jgi:hypothetical protein
MAQCTSTEHNNKGKNKGTQIYYIIILEEKTSKSITKVFVRSISYGGFQEMHFFVFSDFTRMLTLLDSWFALPFLKGIISASASFVPQPVFVTLTIMPPSYKAL